MNKQRETVYGLRRELLEGKIRITEDEEVDTRGYLMTLAEDSPTARFRATPTGRPIPRMGSRGSEGGGQRDLRFDRVKRIRSTSPG